MYYIGIVTILSILIGFAAVKDPASLQGISMAVFWGTILAIVLCQASKREVDGNWLVRVMLIGLFARIWMAFVHLAIGFWFYGGQLDFTGYHQVGVSIGRRFLQGDLSFGGEGNLGTRVIQHLLGLFYLLSGPGIVGLFLLSGLIGFLGSYLFLRAFEIEFPHKRERRFVALSLFLLPSLTYWAILLGKDSWIFLFLGWASYAFVNLLKKIRLRHLVGLLLSIGAIILIRTPVGAVLAFAVGVAWLLKGGQKGPAAIFRPLRFAIYPIVIAVVTIAVFSSYLNQYKNLVAQTSLLGTAIEVGVYKHTGLSTDSTAGGSSLAIGITEASIGGVLGYLPLGMFTFLFRPLIFEAHHALALAAALESTFLLVLVLWRFRSLAVAVRCIFTRPFIAFCAVTFFLLLAMLSVEANFGAIVRHRVMVLPFLLILLAVPRNNKGSGQIAASPAKADGEAR